MPSDSPEALSNTSNDAALDWMRQYETQKRVCDEGNGVLRSIVKRAKADGVNVKAMIATSTLRKLDPDQVRRDMRDQLRYMALRRMPVSATDLFDGWDIGVTEKTQRDDDIWTAEEAGYRAGRHSVPIEDCPYQPGAELHAQWHAWWHKGQAAIARELGPDSTAAPASRERPRRGSQTRMAGTEDTDRKKAGGRKAANGAKRSGRRKGPSRAEDGAQVY